MFTFVKEATLHMFIIILFLPMVSINFLLIKETKKKNKQILIAIVLFLPLS